MCSNIGPKDVLSTLYCGIQYTVSHIVPNVLGHQGIPCIQKSCRNNNTTEIISVVNNNITEVISVICCSEHSHRATENVDGGIRATERERASQNKSWPEFTGCRKILHLAFGQSPHCFQVATESCVTVYGQRWCLWVAFLRLAHRLASLCTARVRASRQAWRSGGQLGILQEMWALFIGPAPATWVLLWLHVPICFFSPTDMHLLSFIHGSLSLTELRWLNAALLLKCCLNVCCDYVFFVINILVLTPSFMCLCKL